MKDWLKEYNKPQRFQAGGPMGAPAEGAPAPGPEGQGGGGVDLDSMLAEYAQTRDPQLAVNICDMLVELVAQQQGGGGGAPAGPEGGMPMARSGAKMNTAPVFKA